MLRLHLGEQWTPAWAETGFLNNSTKTPSTRARQHDLLQDLASYFASHPACEAANFGVTAARANELLTKLAKARESTARGETRRKKLKAARAKAVEKLRMRLHTTIRELRSVLEADSPLWSDFGLHAPAQVRKRQARAVATATLEVLENPVSVPGSAKQAA